MNGRSDGLKTTYIIHPLISAHNEEMRNKIQRCTGKEEKQLSRRGYRRATPITTPSEGLTVTSIVRTTTNGPDG